MQVRFAILAVIVLFAVELNAATVDVIFNAALTNESGWVYSNVAISAASMASVRKKEALIMSPEFPNVVTAIEIEAKFPEGKTPFRIMAIAPVIDGEIQKDSPLVKTLTDENGAIAERLEWDESDGMRQFAIFQKEQTGNTRNFYPISAKISYSSREPTRLSVGRLYRNAFEACWNNHTSVATTSIEVYHEVENAESMEMLAQWDFSGLPAKSNSASVESAFFDRTEHLGLDGENIHYAITNGYIQIGTSKTNGVLKVKSIPDKATTLILRAMRKNSSYGSSMPVRFRKGGQEEGVGSAELDIEPRDFMFVLPADASGAELLLYSTTNHKDNAAVWVQSIKLVKDYVPASTNLVIAKTIQGIAGESRIVRGLEPGKYQWRIKSIYTDETESEYSNYQTVELKESYRPYRSRILIRVE